MFRKDNRKPDFGNLQLVLEKKAPPRPVMFDFILGTDKEKLLTGEAYHTDTELDRVVTTIRAFDSGGWDHAPIIVRGLDFKRSAVHQQQTKSLNEGGVISNHTDLGRFNWPEISDCDFSIITRAGEYTPHGMKLIPFSYDGILENAISLLGYEALCLKLYDDPQLVEDVFAEVGERIAQYYGECLEHDEVGAILCNDDWGFVGQTMLPPAALRKYVFPWYKEIVRAAHKNGKYALLHSCGFYDEIINDIISDMAFDGRHSYEDKIVPVETAYRKLHPHIAVLGGIDVDFLARAGADDVYERCRGMLAASAKMGGYALGSGNSVPDYVPNKNFLAMLRAGNEEYQERLMAGITLKNVKKIYPGGVLAVKDFSLEIPDREFVVLVGPSGCGKSTVLRMIAGLESITEGDLSIGGKRMNDVEPKDRDIAMVFQNYALYPHMSVYENMAFGLKLRHMPRKEIDARVHGAAKTLAIEEYLDRKPKCLSGGQRQRVALGRAIVREPKAFLLDEPLSNLDAKMRTHMRTEINKLHKELGTTFVYVTHDQVEAMTMGTLIVVMKDGVIQQADNAYRLYHQPKNRFVAGFIGTPQMNFIDVTVPRTAGRVDAYFGMHRMALPQRLLTVIEDGAQYILGVRAEDVRTDESDVEAHPECAFEGCVRVIEQLGNEVLLYIEVDGAAEMLIARASTKKLWVRDARIRLAFDTEGVHLFDKTTEESVEKGQP